MPARNGRQYLDGLRAQDRVIYLGGERVRDVTTHPGLASGAGAVAALYDMRCISGRQRQRVGIARALGLKPEGSRGYIIE